MFLAPFCWLARNFGTLLLALILAFVVWVSAVVNADPNEEGVFEPVTINVIGQDPGLLLVGDFRNDVSLTLRAPKSIWATINTNPDLVSAWIDLSGLGTGEHTVNVQLQADISPIRILDVDPEEVNVTLEPLLSKELPIELVIEGEPPLGYRQGEAEVEPQNAAVTGAESVVTQVAEVIARIDLTGAIDTIERDVELVAVDGNRNVIHDVTVTPRVVHITQPVSLLGGFKNVVVKVVTTGKVQEGYRLTNISVSPLTVTLFAENPQLIEDIPGFVETLPVDLTGLQDYYETVVSLNLPEGVRVVSDQRVLVQVSIAAIEGSLTLTVPVEVIGLAPDLAAVISPETVDIIVAGPLNILESLTAEDFQAVVDLSGQPPGVYQRAPEVVRFPEEVRGQTILPETIEVEILVAPTSVPNLTGTVSPTALPSPAPTLTPQP